MSTLEKKLQPWMTARRQFGLSHAEIQMARELGMNPKKFSALATEKQQPWKRPLGEFIADCYFRQFKRELPERVRTLEEIISNDASMRRGPA